MRHLRIGPCKLLLRLTCDPNDYVGSTLDLLHEINGLAHDDCGGVEVTSRLRSKIRLTLRRNVDS